MNSTNPYNHSETVSSTSGWAVIIAFLLFAIVAYWNCVYKNVGELLSYLCTKLCYYPNKLYQCSKKKEKVMVPV